MMTEINSILLIKTIDPNKYEEKLLEDEYPESIPVIPTAVAKTIAKAISAYFFILRINSMKND